MDKPKFHRLKRTMSSIVSTIMATIVTLSCIPPTPVHAGNITWQGPLDSVVNFASGATKSMYYYTAGGREAYCIEPNNLHHTARQNYTPLTYPVDSSSRRQQLSWAIASTSWGSSGYHAPSELDRRNIQALAWSLSGLGPISGVPPYQTKAQYDAWVKKNVTGPMNRHKKGISVPENKIKFEDNGSAQTIYVECNEELANTDLFTTTSTAALKVSYTAKNGSGTAAKSGKTWMKITWNGTNKAGQSITIKAPDYYVPGNVTEYTHADYQDLLIIADATKKTLTKKLTPTFGTLPLTPNHFTVELTKISTAGEPSGGQSLAGAGFYVIKKDALDNFTSVATLVTDWNGYAVSGEIEYTAGDSFYVREFQSPPGFLPVNDFPIDPASKDPNGVIALTVPNVPKYSAVAVKKVDASGRKGSQGNASLGGGVFEVVNANAAPVIVLGVTYQPGAVITTLVTDENGNTPSTGMVLPNGTYIVREKTPPNGYQLPVANEQYVDATGSEEYVVRFDDAPIRGGLKGVKWDATLQKPQAQGDASLAGAKIGLYNKSVKPITIGDKNVMADMKFTPMNADGEVTIQYPFDSTSLTGSDAIYSEETIFDINDDAIGIVGYQGGQNQKVSFDAPPKVGSVTANIPMNVSLILNSDGTSSANFTLDLIGTGLPTGPFHSVEVDMVVLLPDGSPAPCSPIHIADDMIGAGVTRNISESINLTPSEAIQFSIGTAYLTYTIKQGGTNVIAADSGLTNPNMVINYTGMPLLDSVLDPSGSNDSFIQTIKLQSLKAGSYFVKSTFRSRVDDSELYSETKDVSLGTAANIVTSTFPVDTIAEAYVVTEVYVKDGVNDVLIYEYNGKFDPKQNATIGKPGLFGTNTDTATGFNKTVSSSTANVTKTIKYTGLTPGNEYTIKGVLKNVDTGLPFVLLGTVFNPGDLVITFTTDANGAFQTPSDTYLPYGKYELKELSPPTGYLNTGTTTREVLITEHGVMVDMTTKDSAIINNEIRGGFRFSKWDNEINRNEAQGGATLENTVVDLFNRSAKAVFVDGVEYAPGAKIATLSTDALGQYESAANYLPYGSYEIIEVTPPAGYLPAPSKGTDGYADPGIGKRSFTIRENGKIVPEKGAGGLYPEDTAIKNNPMRGDLELVKVSEEFNRLENVPWKLTLDATGESHVIVTDRNGQAKTHSSWNPHGQNTNRGEQPTDGVWFGELAALNEDVGALLYGTYTVEEMRCPANEEYVLIDPFKVTVDRHNVKIDLSTLINRRADTPYISTTATDKATGNHTALTGKKTTIVDTVQYFGLTKGKEYTMKGILMDKATGKALLVDGKKVTAEKTFTPKSPSGTVKLSFTFDSTALEGKSVVVFENLYLDGKEVTSHADIEDEGQTIEFIPPPDAEIGTTALDKDSNSHTAKAGEKTTIVDTVQYEGLTPGKEYTIKGVLMDKATNAPLLVGGNPVTAEKTFKPKMSSGKVKLEFVFDSSALTGSVIVVFEKLYIGEKEVAQHTDINDFDQSVGVDVPHIGTTAIDSETGNHKATPGEKTTIIDTVKYSGLTVGHKYTVSGVLMDKATKKPLLVNGKKITATKTFTAKKSEGSVELEFTFDSSALAGKAVVVFETLLYKDKEVAVHKDIRDKGQTVTFEKPNGGLLIYKVDADTKTPLPGVEFHVYDEKGKDVATVVTDEQGRAKLDLPKGKYTLKETKAPNGYKFDADAAIEIEIAENGAEVPVTVLNSKQLGRVVFELGEDVKRFPKTGVQ